MSTYLSNLCIIIFVLGIFGSSSLGDTLTYSNVLVEEGAIDGQSVGGQTATITIEFQSGLIAEESPFGGVVYGLGELSSASYEFSQAGFFAIDSPQANLEFGSLTPNDQFELSFFEEDLDPLNMLSGATAGNIGLDPLVGETLSEMFARLGDGSSISFTQPTVFEMLNTRIGSMNGGSSFVTQNIVGDIGNEVTLTLNVVPEPASTFALGLFAFALIRRSRCV